MTSIAHRVAALPLHVTGVRLEPLEMTTPMAWTRHSTVVHLLGPEHEGVGEDITYEGPEQQKFQERADAFDLAGHYTVGEFSRALDRQPLFARPPRRTTNWLYRRWAFESAALDLALQQEGTNLAALLGREPQAVEFVVSMGLGSPPSVAGLAAVREAFPGMRFKVDYGEEWTEATVAELAEFGGIDTVDLKAHYHGAFSGPEPNAAMYQAIAEGLPDVWLEDPAWEGDAWRALKRHVDRVTWDAVLHSLGDLVQLPVVPKCVNIKPSRFGFVEELFRVYEYCENQGIEMYGGGQFELGPGRGQLQCLASLFHPAIGNDVAPSGFNEPRLDRGLPVSPMMPALAASGFRWG